MGLSNLQITTIVICLLNRKMFEEFLHGESLSELVGSEFLTVDADRDFSSMQNNSDKMMYFSQKSCIHVQLQSYIHLIMIKPMVFSYPTCSVTCTIAMIKNLFLMLAHLSGTICLKHSATLILPPLSKLPSRCTCLIIISKLFLTALPIPSFDTVCVCVCVCVCVVSVIVKRSVLPPCVVDGRSRNPLCYYYY